MLAGFCVLVGVDGGVDGPADGGGFVLGLDAVEVGSLGDEEGGEFEVSTEAGDMERAGALGVEEPSHGDGGGVDGPAVLEIAGDARLVAGPGGFGGEVVVDGLEAFGEVGVLGEEVVGFGDVVLGYSGDELVEGGEFGGEAEGSEVVDPGGIGAEAGVAEEVEAFYGFGVEAGSVFDEELCEFDATSSADGVVKGVFLHGRVVGVAAVFEEEADGFEAIVVEGVVDGVGADDFGTVVEEGLEAAGVGGFGGVVEGFVVVGVGSVFEEEFGEGGIVAFAAGSPEGRKGVSGPVGVFVGGVGVGSVFEEEAGGGDGVAAFEGRAAEVVEGGGLERAAGLGREVGVLGEVFFEGGEVGGGGGDEGVLADVGWGGGGIDAAGDGAEEPGFGVKAGFGKGGDVVFEVGPGWEAVVLGDGVLGVG